MPAAEGQQVLGVFEGGPGQSGAVRALHPAGGQGQSRFGQLAQLPVQAHQLGGLSPSQAGEIGPGQLPAHHAHRHLDRLDHPHLPNNKPNKTPPFPT